MAACLSGHDFEYKVRKRNPLQFDCNYWEELTNRYARFRIKYIGMIVGSFIVMLLGGAIFYVAAMDLLTKWRINHSYGKITIGGDAA